MVGWWWGRRATGEDEQGKPSSSSSSRSLPLSLVLKPQVAKDRGEGRLLNRTKTSTSVSFLCPETHKATLHMHCQGCLGVLRFCLLVQEFKLTPALSG